MIAKDTLKNAKEFEKYLYSKDSIICLGCDESTFYFAEKKYKVVVLDSFENLKKYKRKINTKYYGLFFLEGKIIALPFKNNSFNAFYSEWNLQKFPLEKQALEIYRVLKKNGLAHLTFLLETKAYKRETVKLVEKFGLENKILPAYGAFDLLKKHEFLEKEVEKFGYRTNRKLVLVLKKR